MSVLFYSLPFDSLLPVIYLVVVYALAAVFSGFAGFGFSAIGFLSLIVLSPTSGIAVLMALSLAVQMAGLKKLMPEFRQHSKSWKHRDGVGLYMAGGVLGLPIGLTALAILDKQVLTIGLGALLIAFAAFSARKPAAVYFGTASPGPWTSVLVGAAGGLLGGFAAFPGAALVVWNSVLGKPKTQGRALTQPFILSMQIIGLLMLCVMRPETFDKPFWVVFLIALPIALLGNRFGISIFLKTGDTDFRKFTLLALAATGLGLVIKSAFF